MPALGSPEEPGSPQAQCSPDAQCSPEARAATAWRPSARRRATVLTLTLLAVGLSIAVVATGPPEPVTYALRLPLLVLAAGVMANAVQWRRRASVTPDEVILRDLVRVRKIPVRAVARVETDGGRVTIRTLNGRRAVVRAVAGPSAADEFANAVVTAAGPGACLADDPAPAPAAVVTPWLVMLLAVAAGLLSAEGFLADPALVTAVLSAAGAGSFAALACFWFWDRPGRPQVSETGS